MPFLPRLTFRSPRLFQPRPLVVSLCGTYLKPEMQSLYRQIHHLKRWRTVVLTEVAQNLEMFPHPHMHVMQPKMRVTRRGNFVLRFWYKHVLRVWPPPRPIGRPAGKFSYNLPPLLDQIKPRLVHVYYGHKAVKFLPLLKRWGGPFLVSFHGVDVVKFMDQPGYPERMREVFERAELVLARSESLMATLRELGCPANKLRLNRSAVPLDLIPFRLREAPADGEWRLIQACRWIAKKGLFTVLEALPRVIQKFPKVKLLLCGSGEDEDLLRAHVREHQLQDHVEFLGWMSQAELINAFLGAHVFLHPSEQTASGDREGVPNSMLEAMASGLPVVATHHGGIPEAVTCGRDGTLVPERRPDLLAEALIALMSSPETLLRMSACAAVSVREAFGIDQRIAALEDCYTEAAELGRARARPRWAGW